LEPGFGALWNRDHAEVSGETSSRRRSATRLGGETFPSRAPAARSEFALQRNDGFWLELSNPRMAELRGESNSVHWIKFRR